MTSPAAAPAADSLPSRFLDLTHTIACSLTSMTWRTKSHPKAVPASVSSVPIGRSGVGVGMEWGDKTRQMNDCSKTLQKLKTRLASVMINARFNRNQHSNYVFFIDPYRVYSLKVFSSVI